MKKIIPFLLFIIFSNTIYCQQSKCIKYHKQTINSTNPFKAIEEFYKNYDINYYLIDLEAHNESTYIKGHVTIKLTFLNNNNTHIKFQLADNLQISKISNTESTLNFTHSNNIINIELNKEYNQNDELKLSIYYSGNCQGDGLRSSKDYFWKNDITYTLSESYHAYEWFPCKQDLNDKIDSLDFFIRVPKNCKGISQGNLISFKEENNLNVYHWKSNYPIVYYLISMTIGDYKEYTNEVTLNSGKKVVIKDYIYNIEGCYEYYKNSLNKTGDLLILFSELFGDYPFYKEKYGHVMAPIGGGMEHQTISTMSTFTYTLIAHELGHQWFGNLVTCKTWQDIFINEAFASYCEYIALEHTDKSAAKKELIFAQNEAKEDSSSIFLSNENPNEKEIFNYNISYKKGEAVLHMIRKYIDNDDLFYEIIRKFLTEFKYKTASIEDFKTILNENTQIDFTNFFNSWIYSGGYPKYTLSSTSTQNQINILLKQESSLNNNTLFNHKLHYYINDINDNNKQSIIIDEKEKHLILNKSETISKIFIDPFSDILANYTNNSDFINNIFSIKTNNINIVQFQNEILIKSNSNKLLFYSLYNLQGKLIYKNNFIKQERLKYNLFKPGIYILKIEENKKNIKTKKIIFF